MVLIIAFKRVVIAEEQYRGRVNAVSFPRNKQNAYREGESEN